MKKFCCLGIYILLLVYKTSGSAVIIADHGMSKMIELSTRPPYCMVQTDRGKIRNKVLNSDPRRVRQISDDSIGKLERACKNSHIQSAYQGGFIYPGTKWCGPGNVAGNYSELGFHEKEDMCCREHDNCPNSLAKGECRLGICNSSPFTRSHCDCDATFRKCLQNVNTETANTIGAIFFNIIQVICFKERTPCTQWQRMLAILPKGFNSCENYFTKSGRYIGSRFSNFCIWNKAEHFLNKILRKLKLL